jgi:hypothetical protein
MLDQLFETRNLLLFGHVVAAIVLLGPLTAAASRFPAVVMSAAPDRAGIAAELHRTTQAYGSASIVVPLLGLVLAGRSQVFGAAWVQASTGLVVAAALLLVGVVLPEQARLVARLRSDASIAIDAAALKRLRMATGVFGLSWVVIVLLMVGKPT